MSALAMSTQRRDLCGSPPDAAQIVEVRDALREGPQSLVTLDEVV